MGVRAPGMVEKQRENCVLGGPFEGYMGMKPIEPGIRALSINDHNIIFFVH